MKKRLLGLSIILGAALVALPGLHSAMAGGGFLFVKLCHVAPPGTNAGHVIAVPGKKGPGPLQVHLAHGDCGTKGQRGDPCTCPP